MTKLRLLGAAAVVLSSALASPVMAQEVIYNPGYCAQFYPNANCQNKGPGNPYTGDYQRRTIYQNSYNRRVTDPNWNNGWHDSWNNNRWDRHDSGFWPGDVAAGVVGGAIGTAGAIATSPFRGDSYAYSGLYNDSYAARSGFVCQPGTWFKGKTAAATSASKMSRSRRQKGGCEAAFFMPAFGHRLSFRRVATNHHPLSKFNIERESF